MNYIGNQMRLRVSWGVLGYPWVSWGVLGYPGVSWGNQTDPGVAMGWAAYNCFFFFFFFFDSLSN